MRLASHIACMGESRGENCVWCGNMMEKDHLGDPGVDGRIILRCILRKWNVSIRTGKRLLMIGRVRGKL